MFERGIVARLLVVSLVLLSSIAAPLAAAQTSTNTVDHVYTDGSKHPMWKTTDLTGYEVRVYSSSLTDGDSETLLFEQSYSGEQSAKWQRFNNRANYDHIRIEITKPESQSVEFSNFKAEYGGFTGGLNDLIDVRVVADTSGDKNLRCGKVEALAAKSVGTGRLIDCNPMPNAFSNADVDELDAGQEHIDIYSEAGNVRAQSKVLSAVEDNYLNDSKTLAWGDAEIAVANSFEEGSTKTAAKADAAKAIENRYARMQINQIQSWNSSVTTLVSLQQTAANETELDASNVVVGGDVRVMGKTGSKTVTLANGTTAAVKTYFLDDPYTNTEAEIGITDGNQSHRNWGENDNLHPGDPAITSPPDSSLDRLHLMYPDRHQHRWSRIENLSSNLKEESQFFVESTYDDYSAGIIEPEDVVSARTAMFRYGTAAAEDGNTTYSSAAWLSSMGYSMPQNSSGLMDVTVSGQEYRGLVMAREAPNGEWQSGQTYDPSAIDGPVWLSSSDGETIPLDSNFTVERIENRDGEEINSTQTTKYVYRTANTTELNQLQDELSAMRENLEQRKQEQQRVVPSGFLGGSQWTPKDLAIIAGGIGALLVAANIIKS